MKLKIGIAVSKLLLILLILPDSVAGSAASLFSRSDTRRAESGTSLEFQLGVDLYQRKDYEQALIFFRQAAAQGDVQAIVQVGLMYDFGQGVPQSYHEAMRWFMIAAQKGDPFAMYLIGHMFEFGEGVPVDLTRAYQWYLKAAQHGYSNAQYAVGKILAQDERNSQRHRDGIKWLRLAAAQCHNQAAELLMIVAADKIENPVCTSGG